eukprot:Rmarinus@m.10328
MGDVADNIEAQLEEVEVLRSMYPEEFRIENADEKDLLPRFRITLPVTYGVEDASINIELSIRYHEKYPSCDPPEARVFADWLHPGDGEKIIRSLYDTFTPGLICVYEWAVFVSDGSQIFDGLGVMKPTNNEDDHHVERTVAETDLSSDDDVAVDMTTPADGADDFPIVSGAPFCDRKSTFQAHLAIVKSREDVRRMRAQLMRHNKIARATHNILAYRIHFPPPHDPDAKIFLQDCDDDGETAAGGRLLHLLEIVDVRDIAVVVSRWYGGIKLGPDRFKHINSVARSLLEECGHVSKGKRGKGG